MPERLAPGCSLAHSLMGRGLVICFGKEPLRSSPARRIIISLLLCTSALYLAQAHAWLLRSGFFSSPSCHSLAHSLHLFAPALESAIIYYYSYIFPPIFPPVLLSPSTPHSPRFKDLGLARLERLLRGKTHRVEPRDQRFLLRPYTRIQKPRPQRSPVPSWTRLRGIPSPSLKKFAVFLRLG